MEFVTKADKEKLERQLAELHALDKVLTERIAEARGHGDLRENSDYHAAREEKGMNNLRIRELEARLAEVHVVHEGDMPEDMVFLGALVQVRDEATDKVEQYKIVGSPGDPSTEYRQVTTGSPIGIALMKARIGDTVRVSLPKGERRLTIIAIMS